MVLAITSIGFHPLLVEAMVDFTEFNGLTLVQQQCLTSILSGRNIFVQSPTSFGKTLVYALALVHQLQGLRPKITCADGVRAVVIVPTRQAAIQTLEVFLKLLKPFKWLVPTCISSDNDHETEKARLLKGFNIVIATPGRFYEFLHTGLFGLAKLSYIVLDEADRVFELGFGNHMQIIVDALLENSKPETPLVVNFAQKASVLQRNKSRLQHIIISATLSPVVKHMSSLLMDDPLFVDMCEREMSEFPKIISIAERNQIEQIDSTANDENKSPARERLKKCQLLTVHRFLMSKISKIWNFPIRFRSWRQPEKLLRSSLPTRSFFPVRCRRKFSSICANENSPNSQKQFRLRREIE